MGVSRNSGWVFVLLSIVVVGLSAVAIAGGHRSAQEPPKSEPVKPAAVHGEMRQFEMMADKLSLTDAQLKDFAALVDLYKPRFEQLAKRGEADRDALFDMAPDDPSYASLTDLVSQDASRSAAEAVTLLAELQGLVYNLLSPEQQDIFLGLRAEQRARMEERRARYRAGDFEYRKGKHRHCRHVKAGEACTHGARKSNPLKEPA